MCSVLINILTAFAMLVHSIGGCCLHHSHDRCSGDDHQVCAVEKDQTSECSHGHHRHAEHDGASESPADPEGTDSPCDGDHNCNETSCVYNKASSTEFTAQTISPFLFENPIADDATLYVPESLVTIDETRFAHDVGSSLYRCALTQSWQL